MEVGGIGIYESDLQRNRTRFSPELCNILGLPVGTEMSYKDASRLIDDRDREAMRATVEQSVRAAEPGKWSGVCRVLRQDGSVRWVSITGRRFYRETRNGLLPVRSIGTVIDITHLRETESPSARTSCGCGWL